VTAHLLVCQHYSKVHTYFKTLVKECKNCSVL